MACAASQAMASANSCVFSSPKFRINHIHPKKRTRGLFTVRASSVDSDCNTEECAPDKEVGKVSLEWIAEDKTKVVGTYPPRNRGWTGYVEKDTAGQTNIYSVEPAVYVAESAISSGTAGSSADGSENTAAVAAGIALVSIAAASSILLQVGKNPPQMQTMEYSGPSLSYYIKKFKPPEIIQALAPTVSETSQNQVESGDQPDSSTVSINVVS
ncbi:protein MAINTENANCE OF PSII UNDER HIGH LIGHT 1 [Malania oleifera]|uniref:protein MAINTENANCE OF PSII UNDER HIGH LIGHT 1 n=1 Tax=Malania oleifera TaxID=397392 RepID=UPI0025ADCEB8|nr:protein MAINTENANCE OF PSII UNDER HIGH LIGHT 1 [Malania oleifera]